jgi:hypothetical protein
LNGNTNSDIKDKKALSRFPPYSLGKLIEWKQILVGVGLIIVLSPYSLGKLIEWKLKNSLGQVVFSSSLLVREIN